VSRLAVWTGYKGLARLGGGGGGDRWSRHPATHWILGERAVGKWSTTVTLSFVAAAAAAAERQWRWHELTAPVGPYLRVSTRACCAARSLQPVPRLTMLGGRVLWSVTSTTLDPRDPRDPWLMSHHYWLSSAYLLHRTEGRPLLRYVIKTGIYRKVIRKQAASRLLVTDPLVTVVHIRRFNHGATALDTFTQHQGHKFPICYKSTATYPPPKLPIAIWILPNLIRGSLGPTDPSSQTAYRSDHPFFHNSRDSQTNWARQIVNITRQVSAWPLTPYSWRRGLMTEHFIVIFISPQSGSREIIIQYNTI